MEKLVPSVEPSPSVPKQRKRDKRTPRFTSQLAKRIYDLAVKGRTVAEISRDIGVSIHALNNWAGAQEHFAEAVKAGRRVADELVVASLFQRATGYSHPAVKVFYCKERGIVVHEYIEHYAPDTTACIFWLKNRMRSKWSDATEFHGSMAATIQTGEIEALAARLETILRDTHESNVANAVAAAGTPALGSNGNANGVAVAAGNAAPSQAEALGAGSGIPEDQSGSATLPTSAATGLLENEV